MSVVALDQLQQRRPVNPFPLRVDQSAGRERSIALQRSAGNRAVAAILGGAGRPIWARWTPPQVSVQRCGSIPSEVCPCHGDDQTAAPAAPSPVQRSLTPTDQVQHDAAIPAALDPRTIWALQRTAGNGAVASLLGHRRTRARAARPSVDSETEDASPDAVPAKAVPSGEIVVQRDLSAPQAENVARKLHDAMEGWGTDEDAIYGAVSGRTAADMQAIREAYRRLYGEDLDAELRDELTDDELAKVSQMMAPVADESTLTPERREEAAVDRARVIADQLREAMEGLGTDEEQIFASLSGRTHEEIGEIKRQYLELTGNYLERDLQDELSGEDLRRAFNLLDVAGEFERIGFSECTPDIREKLREFVPKAKEQTTKAIRALQPGWRGLDDATRTRFREYFDPSTSGQIDARFVELVRENFRTIATYMAEGLEFDCELTSGSICGDGIKWCGEGDGNGRLYWTCFGALHVCANPRWMRADDTRRWSDIIHESTHNALHTTDRSYCGESAWRTLTPYGTGVGSFLMNVPVVGFFAKLAGGGGDTLHNPDSYSHFAQGL